MQFHFFHGNWSNFEKHSGIAIVKKVKQLVKKAFPYLQGVLKNAFLFQKTPFFGETQKRSEPPDQHSKHYKTPKLKYRLKEHFLS